MTNVRERQTYFGAVDPLTGELTVMEAVTANAAWTIRFLDYLRECYPGKQLILCWDGASYHRSLDVRAYLQRVNTGHCEADWPIRCIQFAPNAPQQNPIEDVWLQTKAWVRRNWSRLDGTFDACKALFEEAIMTLKIDFPKLRRYTSGLQIT